MPRELSFDEQATFSANIRKFKTFIKELDERLGIVLSHHLTKLPKADPTQVLDELLLALAPPAVGGVVPVNVTTAPAPAAVPPGNVTGWLIAGVSIEGFRGINNEGSPLVLTFHPEKINSVSAVNGVGKSSIYDALRFAISGRLAWLDGLPAAEHGADYYLNRFNKSGLGTVKLKLQPDGGGQSVEITVTRDASGKRTVTTTSAWNPDAILADLDREFVFLDGPTFQEFIDETPLNRGRTFAGLLGLAEYSKLRQALAALANTRAFNNHFGTGALDTALKSSRKAVADANATLLDDYRILTGATGTMPARDQAQVLSAEALSQVPVLAELCSGKTFGQIDVDELLASIKVAEGGPKRERLGELVRERAKLSDIVQAAPDGLRATQLVELAAARAEAASRTSGNIIYDLLQAGSKVLGEETWSDPHLCPLCNNLSPHHVRDHVTAKLKEFAEVENASAAIAAEWQAAGWPKVKELEALLEPDAQARILTRYDKRTATGDLSVDEAKALLERLSTLRARTNELDGKLDSEQTQLEQELPPSLVELTKKVEAARRLQRSWKSITDTEAQLAADKSKRDQILRVKTFVDRASAAFDKSEAAIGKARLKAVEPRFVDFFKGLSFFGVKPMVAKPEGREELQLLLSDFYGLSDLSPQAILSESYKNAFAIALYLAAASLYGGPARFIFLDDVTSSLDAGHQNFLVELLRQSFARPLNAQGLQVILLSHDTMLEKLFNKHSNDGGWSHQRIEGTPQFMVLPQVGAVANVRDQTRLSLMAGQVDSAKEGVRQYLEFRLNEVISKLRIPVPLDIAFNDGKQLSSEYLNAIESAVRLHQAANSLVLTPTQVTGLNANMTTIVGNYLSHWGTGQALAYSGQALLGVMQAIDDYCDCFKHTPTGSSAPIYYRALDRVS